MPNLNTLIKGGTSLIVVIYNRYFHKEWQGQSKILMKFAQ